GGKWVTMWNCGEGRVTFEKQPRAGGGGVFSLLQFQIRSLRAQTLASNLILKRGDSYRKATLIDRKTTFEVRGRGGKLLSKVNEPLNPGCRTRQVARGP